MKFSEKKPNAWSLPETVGKKNNFRFCIAKNSCKKYYICVEHCKKDIFFNSDLAKIHFTELEDAKAWCEKFDYKNFECFGDDV